MDGFVRNSVRARIRQLPLAALLLIGLLTVAGCASDGGVKQVFGKTLQAVGLREAAPQAHAVPLQLRAGDNLNAADGTRALSLVVRIYQLRDKTRFEEAPFEVFLDEQRERDVLGGDLLAVTEYFLAPGQQHEVREQLPVDGRHLGVVALFRAPAPTRWRFAFDAGKAADAGVIVGLHACAMTTTSSALETVLASAPHSLSGSRCRPAAR